MLVKRWTGSGAFGIALALGGVLGGALAASPASAQFYFQSKDLSGERVTGAEQGVMEPLPGATAAEQRAGLTWTLRAALNVAALQCQFEPSLLTVSNYNAVLKDHNAELKGAFDTLTAYFKRVNKSAAVGQSALDQFGTRTYSRVTSVFSQLNFCQTASVIGRDAVFTPRGHFGDVAEARMRELRNAMTPWGEQKFPRLIGFDRTVLALPRLDAACWDKKMRWQVKKCGDPAWPPAGTGIAAR